MAIDYIGIDRDQTLSICQAFAELSPAKPFRFLNYTFDDEIVRDAKKSYYSKKYNKSIRILKQQIKICTGENVGHFLLGQRAATDEFYFHRDRFNSLVRHGKNGFTVGFSFKGPSTVFLNTTFKGIELLTFDNYTINVFYDRRPLIDLHTHPALVSAQQGQIAIWLTGENGAVHSTPLASEERILMMSSAGALRPKRIRATLDYWNKIPFLLKSWYASTPSHDDISF